MSCDVGELLVTQLGDDGILATRNKDQPGADSYDSSDVNRPSKFAARHHISPDPRPQIPKLCPSTAASHLPSWLSAWSKPTVAPAQLKDGMQLRDFVARPLPPSSAQRIGFRSNSSGGTFAGPSRAASTGRSAWVASNDRADAGNDASGSTSSMLLHFIRASSGPCGAMAAPVSVGQQPLRTLRTSYSGGNSGGSGLGSTAGARPNGCISTHSSLRDRSSRGRLTVTVMAEKTPGSAGALQRRLQPSSGPRPATAVMLVVGDESRLTTSAQTENATPAVISTGPDASGAAEPTCVCATQQSLASGEADTFETGETATAVAAPVAAATGGTTHTLTSSATRPTGRFSGRLGAAGWFAGAVEPGTFEVATAAARATVAARARAVARATAAAGGILFSAGREAVPCIRGPVVTEEQLRLGPTPEDTGCKVAASDLMLAVGGGGRRGVELGSGGGGGDVEVAGGDSRPATAAPRNIPVAQHMLLSGSLQELYERLLRSGDGQLVHLSLGSVTFSGDLNVSRHRQPHPHRHYGPLPLNDSKSPWPGAGAGQEEGTSAGEGAGRDPDPVLRIQHRTVILHNCTLAFMPGQRLYVGAGGHVILADVTVIGLLGATAAPGSGSESGCQATTPRSSDRPPPSPSSPPSSSQWRSGGGTPRNRGSRSNISSRGAGVGAALLHAAAGGRLLLRGCCVKTVSAAAVGCSSSGGGGDATSGSQAPASPITRQYRAAATSAMWATGVTNTSGTSATRGRGGGTAAANTAVQPILSIVAESGAAVEAVGCRLENCAAVGDSTWLALRRCRIKPSTVDVAVGSAAAPLICATNGSSVELSQTELREGVTQGIAAAGTATRVALSRSAVSCCSGHGVLLKYGASLTADGCRLSSNGASGLALRSRGTTAELRDCDLSYNVSSNLCAASSASVSMVSCAAMHSGSGCGAALEGAGTRLLAAACIFDGNVASGLRVRRGTVVELHNCSGSGNAGSGLEVYGTADPDDNAELLAEAMLACAAPPPPPLPEVFSLVVGGQLAKNGGHGCVVRHGGGLRVTGGCEISQNGRDGACADGVGCELLLDGGCVALGNGESGLFVCSGAGVWANGCRLGSNKHGDVAVGGRGSRGRLVGCSFDYNFMTVLRVHMGAKVALRGCTMEPPPAGTPMAPRAAHRLRQLRTNSTFTATTSSSTGSHWQHSGGRAGKGSSDSGGGAVSGPVARSWTVDTVRSQSVQLRGRGSALSVDGQAFFPLEEEDLGEDMGEERELRLVGLGPVGGSSKMVEEAATTATAVASAAEDGVELGEGEVADGGELLKLDGSGCGDAKVNGGVTASVSVGAEAEAAVMAAAGWRSVGAVMARNGACVGRRAGSDDNPVVCESPWSESVNSNI